MSTAELNFTVGDLEVVVGAEGFPVRVRCISRPGQDYLAAQRAPGELIMDDRIQRWEPAGLITDVDETEARYAVADHPHLEYTVRNSFSGHWQQRHMLVNTSSSPVRINRWLSPVAPAAGCVGWAAAIGGDAFWAVQPADGNGPLLTAELIQGSVTELVGGDVPGLATGEIMLPANRRVVLQWRIDTAADTAHINRSRRPVLSGLIDLGMNEPYEIADADSAVVADDPVVVTTEGDVQVLSTGRPGRYPVELRSGRGTTRIDLAWIPPVDELITDLSRSWLDRRTAAGVGVVPGPGAALGLQQAVIGRLADDLDDAEDALALHTERLLGAAELSIMSQAYLAQESVRTGDPEPLRHARAAVLASDRPVPGLGLAATRVCLADLALGGSPAAVIARLRELAAESGNDGDHRSDDHLVRAAARLELITVIGPSAARNTEETVRSAMAVGAELGSGLPGARIGGLPAGPACYAAAVLDLLPDSLGADLERRWGVSAHTLADRIRTSALATTLFPPDAADRGSADLDETIGWLVLGRPAG
ncbi:hypothetical protein [Microlunatus sp. Gsoil 973]|uniref:hypothetical protein n=1 Tax=Microlunatus sp. Gsoil 973 TaxID=2672569 RepID=UPI0012B4D672|nr:hypothetical protein [Microlunatus sp. Gsoil 973]QGN31629.1 hypothetical protein GJV80_00925 [Microlunatus sp. Gsoil 973]